MLRQPIAKTGSVYSVSDTTELMLMSVETLVICHICQLWFWYMTMELVSCFLFLIRNCPKERIPWEICKTVDSMFFPSQLLTMQVKWLCIWAWTKTHFILCAKLWSGPPIREEVTALQYALMFEVCYQRLRLCCWIACSKYELIPLQRNAPNPNKRPTSTLYGSSAPLMDRLSTLLTHNWQKEEPMNIYHKVKLFH